MADDFDDIQRVIEEGLGEFLRGVEEASHRSLAEVISADESDAMEDEDFDEAVWYSLCSRVETIQDLTAHSVGVCMYFATRLIEWEIANGGFAQAICNAADFFDEAIAGYRLLGDEASAALLVRAQGVAIDDDALEAIDGEIDGPPWNGVPWSDAARVGYVREHRDEFRLR